MHALNSAFSPGVPIAFPEINYKSVKVEQVLSEVQISRSRLRLLLVWLEQVAPTVTDSTASNGARNDDERHPPNLALANSILSILGEPLPSDGLSSNVKTPRSRVRIGVHLVGYTGVQL